MFVNIACIAVSRQLFHFLPSLKCNISLLHVNRNMYVNEKINKVRMLILQLHCNTCILNIGYSPFDFYEFTEKNLKIPCFKSKIDFLD
jgi:hypothetical protein